MSNCFNCQTKKRLKICCLITAIFIIIIIATLITIYFTLLKPKQPKIITQLVTLDQVKLVTFPTFHLNITISLVISVHNPNYGSFEYENSTAYVTYRGSPAAVGPIQHDKIPARGNVNVSTDMVITADKFVTNSNFFPDFISGCLNFSSSTTLHGKATVFKVFKLKATTYSTCDISVFVWYQNVTAECRSKIDF